MKKRILSLILLSAYGCLVQAQLPGLPTFATRAKAYLDSLGRAQAFSGGVLFVKDGQVRLEHYVGYADWGKQKPFTPTTAFNVGSNTKDITKLLIAQLIAAGKLQYTDKLGTLFPDWPADKHAITVAQLLTHTSGLGDYFRDDAYDFAKRMSDVELASIIAKSELLFVPGRGQEYSNSGYVTLGLIITKLHGKPYTEVVQTQVFDKLGMRHSYIHGAGHAAAAASAHFKRLQGGFAVEAGLDAQVMTRGDGCTYHSISDWLVFVQKGFLGDGLINKATRMAMMQTLMAAEPSRAGGPGGPGKTIVGGNGRGPQPEEAPIFDGGFAGGLPGWNTCFEISSKHNMVLIVFSNGAGAVALDQPAEDLVPVMADLLRGKSPRPFAQAPDVRVYEAIKQHGIGKILADPRGYLQQQGSDLPGPFVLQRVGLALVDDKAEANAIAVFEANNKLFARYAPSYMALGRLYEGRGENDKAKATYQKLLGIHPDHEAAKAALKRL